MNTYYFKYDFHAPTRTASHDPPSPIFMTPGGWRRTRSRASPQMSTRSASCCGSSSGTCGPSSFLEPRHRCPRGSAPRVEKSCQGPHHPLWIEVPVSAPRCKSVSHESCISLVSSIPCRQATRWLLRGDPRPVRRARLGHQGGARVGKEGLTPRAVGRLPCRLEAAYPAVLG